MSDTDEGADDARIAIIGMAGRFPGAADVGQFWDNVTHGRPGIREITDEELVAAGVTPALLADPAYVRRGAPLEGAAEFDAPFFGYSPREAEAADPQHRMFLECSWEALEFAGYPPDAVPGRVGVFGGAAFSVYGVRHVLSQPDVMAALTIEQFATGITPDALCTMVAYKLGLTGPALGVQTSCSTSLVAVHLAVQSLLTYDCDTALAGGVEMQEPLPTGYRYEEGSISAPDGRVHSLDADAHGTVHGNGVGMVVLKRLADARRDGDHVWAVLLGSALNNDGAARAGYTAPGMQGQRSVIDYAMRVAEVNPATVAYVECHAPGTRLGDSIEIAAMDGAYPGVPATPRVLSSLKPDVGHLERASGVAGLIKATFALHHRVLPATRGYRTPNPALAAVADRFTVLTENQEWPATGTPRRAGVNSFGAGGTNVHVVLEEAPDRAVDPAPAGAQLLVLSARTATALDAAVHRLRAHLREPGDLADVAHTLQVGRSAFPYRAAVVCHAGEDPAAVLADVDRVQRAGPVRPTGRTVVPAEPEEAARVWLGGDTVDWSALHSRPRRRVPLPTYPFDRLRYFVDLVPDAAPGTASEDDAGRIADMSGWFSHPVWRAAPLLAGADPARLRELGPWWVVATDDVGRAAARQLGAAGAEVLLLDASSSTEACTALLADRPRPRSVLHTGGLAPGEQPADDEQGFHAVRAVVGAITGDRRPGPVDVLLCTGGAVQVTGGDLRAPQQAPLLGLVPVLNQEFGDLRCRLVDVDLASVAAARGGAAGLAAELLAEAVATDSQPVALRGADRWVRAFDPLPVGPPSGPGLPAGATVLITGAFGRVGEVLAGYLARTYGANLVLTGRTPVPPEGEWAAWLDTHPDGDPTSHRIRILRNLLAQGAGGVLAVAADVADRTAMAAGLAAARQRFGPIDAVLHAAGTQGEPYFGFAPELSRDVCDLHLASKVTGLLVLHELLEPGEAPVRLTFSSLAAILGGVTYGAYAAANAGMDAYAAALGSGWLPVNWDTWNLGEDPHGEFGVTLKDYFVDAADGCAVLERCLAVAGRVRQLVISTGPLGHRLDQWTRPGAAAAAPAARTRYPRPELPSAFVAPASAEETALAEMWCELLAVTEVGVDDSFFDLGGHSLAAVRMLAQVRERFGGFPMEDFLANPTVREFGRVLAAREIPEAHPNTVGAAR